MDNENSTAFDETQSGEQAEVVAPQDETPTDAAGQAEVVAPQDEGGNDGEDDSVRAGQSREENAAIRAARLRERRNAEAQARSEAEKRFRDAGVMNPLTGKPFESLDEWDEYAKRLKEQDVARRAKETGKTKEEIAEEDENRQLLAELRRAKRQKEQEEKDAKARRAFLEKDVADFLEKNPGFGVKELTALEQNRHFRQFCGSRFGKEPLAELYADYVAIVGDAGKAAVVGAEKRAARSTGGGTSGASILTPSQKTALDRWNAEHPEMAMTAKEFLSR